MNKYIVLYKNKNGEHVYNKKVVYKNLSGKTSNITIDYFGNIYNLQRASYHATSNSDVFEVEIIDNCDTIPFFRDVFKCNKIKIINKVEKIHYSNLIEEKLNDLKMYLRPYLSNFLIKDDNLVGINNKTFWNNNEIMFQKYNKNNVDYLYINYFLTMNILHVYNMSEEIFFDYLKNILPEFLYDKKNVNLTTTNAYFFHLLNYYK
jgi:hypothetical protein